MAYSKYPPLNKNNLKTISIKNRKSLVHIGDFGRAIVPGAGFADFLRALPDLMAGKELKEFVGRLGDARKKEKPILWGIGGHIIKVGLSPLLIDLMERGWVSAIAVDGSFIIHDFEIALAGATSENLSANLYKGTYGNAQETGLFLNLALKEGLKLEMGAGEAVGYYLHQSKFMHQQASVLYQAYKLQIPVTVHPAIGADFIHYHPNFSGEVAGALAEKDFFLLAAGVSQLADGGIYLNIGSAVILPEVFIKAVSFVISQGSALQHFYTAVFDFQREYRSLANICQCPVAAGGKGYCFIGADEIMIPLLAALILNAG